MALPEVVSPEQWQQARDALLAKEKVTVYGRQEEWEDSPDGWPQIKPYQWWHLHDEY
jgi:predicted dithiol-disulfide oxidoreductase (DUF899 family)